MRISYRTLKGNVLIKLSDVIGPENVLNLEKIGGMFSHGRGAFAQDFEVV